MNDDSLDVFFRESVREALESVEGMKLPRAYVTGRQRLPTDQGLHFSEAVFVSTLFQKLMGEGPFADPGSCIGWEVAYPLQTEKSRRSWNRWRADLAYGLIGQYSDEKKGDSYVFRRPIEVKLWHEDAKVKSDYRVVSDGLKLWGYQISNSEMAPLQKEVKPIVLVVCEEKSLDSIQGLAGRNMTAEDIAWEDWREFLPMFGVSAEMGFPLFAKSPAKEPIANGTYYAVLLEVIMREVTTKP